MENTPDIILRIRERLNALGFSERYACLQAGLGVDAIRNMRNGHRPSAKTIAALAQALQVTPNYLMGSNPVFNTDDALTEARLMAVPVKGSVEGNRWLEAIERPRDEWFNVVVPRDRRFPAAKRFGLQVIGPAMDRLYPDGSIVVAVLFEEIGRGPKTGEKVLFVRRCKSTSRLEASIREYEHDKGGRHVFWPRSLDPEHQATIILPAGKLPITATPRATGANETHEMTACALIVMHVAIDPVEA